MLKLNILCFSLLTATLFSCSENSVNQKVEPIKKQSSMIIKDVHSYSEPENAVVTNLNWVANIDFENKLISATATYDFELFNGNVIHFDTKGLNIIKVTDENDEELNFTHNKSDDILGTDLAIEINDKIKNIQIEYTTSKDAAALQWLNPQQTADKKAPYLFTQSQAILARTWIPCQDSPGIRFTYNAQIKVPIGLMAVMSAENPKEKSEDGIYKFKMEQAIPSYLMALAVGDFEYAQIGPRTGVYAESSLMAASKYEFADMENMVISAENLYGEYPWGRFDMIVLPPSFPFGGMENPRITFATPTIIAGDRSLTSLVAHELAHSWSGNLVTNATWDDFWLNEGFTVYFERRIMEELYGKSYAEMLALLGFQDLQETLEELKDNPEDTHLKLSLENRDPDDGMTDIAYEKGYFLLRTIEENVGRENFDKFLKEYFSKNKFKVMTTEEFIQYFKNNLVLSDTTLNIEDWIYKPGLPKNCFIPESDRFEKVEFAISTWEKNNKAQELNTKDWTTHEWLHFIRNLPPKLTLDQMKNLDESFGFTISGNAEILAAWFQHTIKNNYSPANEKVDSFLVNVGRRKFLTPTYKAFLEVENGKKMALKIYKKAKPNYHSVSTNTLDALLKK